MGAHDGLRERRSAQRANAATYQCAQRQRRQKGEDERDDREGRSVTPDFIAAHNRISAVTFFEKSFVLMWRRCESSYSIGDMPQPTKQSRGGSARAAVLGHDGAVDMGRQGARVRWGDKTPEERRAEWAKGRKQQPWPRCPCGRFTIGVAKDRSHKCTAPPSVAEAELSLNCNFPDAVV